MSTQSLIYSVTLVCTTVALAQTTLAGLHKHTHKPLTIVETHLRPSPNLLSTQQFQDLTVHLLLYLAHFLTASLVMKYQLLLTLSAGSFVVLADPFKCFMTL